MAGTLRRGLLIGAVLLGALSACGQAVGDSIGTSTKAGAAPSQAVPNPAIAGGEVDTTGYPLQFGNQPLTPLQRRSAGDVQLRLFTASMNGGETCNPDSTQCVPAWCEPTGLLVAEVSNEAMAAARAVPVIGLGQGSQISLLGSPTVGTAEHSPVQLVMVRVAGDVSQVRFITASGSDTAAPVNGLAVLAVPGTSNEGTISVLDGDGQVRGSIRLPQADTQETPDCSAQPVPLPTPGKQPADPAAADKAVRAAYAKAFTAVPGDTSYSSLSAVQNGDALHGTLDQLRHNFAQAAASSSVEIGQVIFTDPQTAALKFTLHYTGGIPYGTHNGTAVFENGTWLVSQVSYCAVMQFGGATCPGK